MGEEVLDFEWPTSLGVVVCLINCMRLKAIMPVMLSGLENEGLSGMLILAPFLSQRWNNKNDKNDNPECS